MGIPTLIQEQNAIPGVTNRILARFVRKIAAGYGESREYFNNPKKVVITGNPIRPEIVSTKRLDGIKTMSLRSTRKTLLVFGASQGSKKINNVMLEAICSIKDMRGLQVIWVTGHHDYDRITAQINGERGIEKASYGNIIIKPYIDNMEYAYAACDYVICRGGAISLAEITARGIPAIVVPYPYATDNHQEHNARALSKHGAAFMILDKDLTAEKLMENVKLLVENPQKVKEMKRSSHAMGKPNATEKIVNLINEMLI